MFKVAVIPIPSTSDLQQMLNDEADQGNMVVSIAVNGEDLIIVFKSSKG